MANDNYCIIRGRKIPIKRWTFGSLEVEAGTNAHIIGIPSEKWYSCFCIRNKVLISDENQILIKHVFRGDPADTARALRFVGNALAALAKNNINITEAEINVWRAKE